MFLFLTFSADFISMAGSDDSASKWMELEIEEDYSVNITHFGSCNSFFLKVDDKNSKWKEMQTMLNNFKPCKKLLYPKAGTLCLTMSRHGLDRAKIIRSSRNSYIVFLVDYGKCLFFNDEVIPAYEMTPEIKHIMPFQTINCRLAGLSAPSDYQWTRYIYHKYVKNMREPKIRVVKGLKSNQEKIPWGLDNVNSYEVELYESGNEKNTIGDILFKLQIAGYYT